MAEAIKTKTSTVKVSDEIGTVSTISKTPAKPVALLTIAHGAGAGMTHPFMEELANSLAEVGIATLRFNFPYMENKKGRPDFPPVAHKTIEAVIVKATKDSSKLPLFVAGKSFGGRMTS